MNLFLIMEKKKLWGIMVGMLGGVNDRVKKGKKKSRKRCLILIFM